MRIFHKNICTILILSATLSGQTTGKSVYGRYTGPHSLGHYSLDRDVPMKSLLSMFGAKPTGKDTYCFADKEHGLYLYMESGDGRTGLVEIVLLSTYPNCRHLPVHVTTIDPSVWKTPEGIGIGSTKDEVVRAYHKPVFVKKLGKDGSNGEIANPHNEDISNIYVGDTSYLYSCRLSAMQGCDNDLRVTRFGFSAGKLIWICISNSE
jgi:hypothetical protein